MQKNMFITIKIIKHKKNYKLLHIKTFLNQKLIIKTKKDLTK